MRKVGRLGEDDFKRLATLANVTCNKSHDDETGWDFLIEFPFDATHPVPLDMSPPPTMCLVQVRATDRTAKYTELKLSNLLRLINQPLPAFVVAFEYQNGDTAKSIYVRHIGQAEIEAVLREIRRLEASGNRRINHETLSIKLTEEDRAKNMSGPELFSEIKKKIGRPFATYANWKRQIVENTGFDGPHSTATFSFASEDPLKDFVDLMLGIKPELQFESHTIQSTRFGIDLIYPKSSDAGTLTVESKPAGTCRLIFSGADGAKLTLNGEYYLPGIPQLPAKYRKVRVVAGPIELTFHLGDASSSRLNLTYSMVRPCKLSELLSLFRLVSLSANGLNLAITIKGGRLLSGSGGSFDAEYLEYWRRGSKCLELLSKIGKRFKHRFVLSAKDVLEQLRQLETLNLLFRGRAGSFKIALTPTEGFQAERTVGKEVGCVFATSVRIADKYLVLVLLRKGVVLKASADTIVANTRGGRVLKCLVLEGNSEQIQSVVRREIEKASAKHQGKFENFIAVY